MNNQYIGICLVYATLEGVLTEKRNAYTRLMNSTEKDGQTNKF